MLLLLLAALDSAEDKHVFARFYQRHKTDLYRYACTLCPSPALAEEAVQEGWMRCVQYAETFFALPPERRLPWMVVVVRNAALSLRKKEAKHQTLDPDWDGPAPSDGDVSGIMEVIRAMPEQYRTILELKFVLELDDREIARRTGLSVTAVSTRVSRGRKLLQQRLIEEGYHV